MFISRKHEFIFIRVPKTGSTTAKKALKNTFLHLIEQGEAHETYAEACVRDPLLETLGADFRLTAFVRKPIPWLNAMYVLLRNAPTYAHKWMGCDISKLTGTPSSAFLEAMPMTPYDWFTDADGAVRATDIWRMEDMKDFTDHLDLPPLWENHTPKHFQVRLPWTPDDYVIIRKRFERELEHYR